VLDKAISLFAIVAHPQEQNPDYDVDASDTAIASFCVTVVWIEGCAALLHMIMVELPGSTATGQLPWRRRAKLS
jgi:hypothetical protein